MISVEDFDQHRISPYYDPAHKSANEAYEAYVRVHSHTNSTDGSPTRTPRRVSGLSHRDSLGGRSLGLTSTQASQAQQFVKGIKKDSSAYNDFKNENQWESWHRHFKIVCANHDCTEIIDPNYIVPSIAGDDKDLFDKKQIYMYSVFQDHLKTDMGRRLVRRYSSTMDARQLYGDLVTHMMTSSVARIYSQKLLAYISSHRIEQSAGKCTYRSSLLNWTNKVDEYNETNPAAQLSRETCRNMLMSMLSGVKELNDIPVHEVMASKITGSTVTFTYEEYTSACH